MSDYTKRKKVLITGGAGFVGYHVARYIMINHADAEVVIVDNLNHYYDTQLKKDRLAELDKLELPNYQFVEVDITDKKSISSLFEKYSFTTVINLAAQAGVRYARENPESYIKSNIEGFYNIAELSAKYGVEMLIYASSSSVYGANVKVPFEENDTCISPMSLYAATKLSNEHIAAAYYYTHGLSSVGLRFFNVYGPWGRPDMAYFKWSKNLIDGTPIELRDDGNMYRDMTYIDDVVRVIETLFARSGVLKFKHEIFNVGNEDPVKVIDMLSYIQQLLRPYSSDIKSVSRGSEEPYKTFASTKHLKDTIGFIPNTSYKEGLDLFMDWFKKYYNI